MMSVEGAGGGAKHRVVIVGGGASGVLLAAHLLRGSGCALEVHLIEKEPEIGKGLAYSTDHPHHLLNVRAANMSAFGDEPDHLVKWLASRQHDSGISDHSFFFIERKVYSQYLATLIAPALESRRLHLHRSEAVDCRTVVNRITVTLADGSEIVADVLVAATGHERRAEQWYGTPYASPWRTPTQSGVHPQARVVILGTGLTMVDYALALVSNGHRGRITAISRNGRLPQVHRTVPAVVIDREDIPFGVPLGVFFRWMRDRIVRHERQGHDWRACIDALRPYSWEIWRSLSLADKRRFQRHVRGIWDVHRHRMAPDVQGRIDWLVASGQLVVSPGRMLKVAPVPGGGVELTYRPRGRKIDAVIEADRFVDCSGIQSNPRQSSNPFIRRLVDRGLARSDALDLGLETTNHWALVDSEGRASERLFAIGPLTRYAGWETIAIPDIRLQCAELANQIRSLDA